MKRKITALFALTLSVLAVLSLGGCGLFSVRSSDDNFPYDVAESGVSEADWLARQQSAGTIYRRMWEEAVDNGFRGTYIDFLQQVGISQADDAYIQRALCSAVSIEAYYPDGSGDAGSGVIYSLDTVNWDAYILTNYHVVYNADNRYGMSNEIYVWLYGGEADGGTLRAEYVGGAPAYDVAILKVDGDTVVKETDSLSAKTHTNKEILQRGAARAAELGDSDSVTVSERVYAIGNAVGWGISVSGGILSVDAEYITMEASDGVGDVSMLEMRIDAPVNHGNSGGGLFNAAGELIGIVNARSEASGVVNVGYALPINQVLAVVRNIVDNNMKLKSAKLGITVVTEDSKSLFNERTGKVYIQEKIVVRSVDIGAAAAAGLEQGDTLVSATLNGTTVDLTRRYKLTTLLLDVRLGDSMTLVVSRGGAKEEVTVIFNRETYFAAR